jgi:ABC-type branched-subunit amino acid transport system substrate-binding protein
VDDEAAALARWLHDDGVRANEVCLAGDASPGTAPFLHAVAGRLAGRAATMRLGPDLALGGLVARIRRTGCDVVVWGGEGETGGAVAAALAGHRRRPVVAGGSNLRDPAFDETAGPAARGAISASSCTELSTETRLAAQRFVQDYQSQFARPPGTCAVEAWDLARWLLRAIGDGGVTRPSLLEQLGASTPFDGVAGTFDFAADGEPAGDSAVPRLWRFEAGRWAPAG